MRKLIAAVKAFAQKMDDLNYRDYDASQVERVKVQLSNWKWQDAVSRKIASKEGSYSDWYRKMLAVKQSRQDAVTARIDAESAPYILHRQHEEAAMRYMAAQH